MRYELTDYEWSAIKPFHRSRTSGRATVPALGAQADLNARGRTRYVGCVARPK